MNEEEDKPPVKVCGSCSKSLIHQTVYLFDLEHMKKYTFICETCDIKYDVYINEKTRFRASYQNLLSD